MPRTIEILPYQPRWRDEFRAAEAALRAALGPLALSIDHIGSTSVPGLGAKDVIDVQVTVASFDPLEPLLAAFRAAGYEPRAFPAEDHRPAGDTRAPEHWQKLYVREPAGARRTHIHVRAAGRANQRYALLFRDFLRAHPHAAAAYEQIKRALAAQHPHDIDAYLAANRGFRSYPSSHCINSGFLGHCHEVDSPRGTLDSLKRPHGNTEK